MGSEPTAEPARPEPTVESSPLPAPGHRSGGASGPPGRGRPAWLRWLVSAAAVAFKAKFLLLFLSVFVSLAIYGLAFGWAFGAGLLALLAAHESGHAVAIRRRGLAASLPYFIPFLGAVIGLRQAPRDAAEEAYIAIAGPVTGLAATAVCWALFARWPSPLLAVLVATGMMIHIFNLLPVVPLDGGRAVAFLRWWAWGPGLLALFAALFYDPFARTLRLDPFALVILAFVLLQFRSRLLRPPPPAYDRIGPRARWGFGLLWFALLSFSVWGYLHAPLA